MTASATTIETSTIQRANRKRENNECTKQPRRRRRCAGGASKADCTTKAKGYIRCEGFGRKGDSGL